MRGVGFQDTTGAGVRREDPSKGQLRGKSAIRCRAHLGAQRSEFTSQVGRVRAGQALWFPAPGSVSPGARRPHSSG